MSANSRQELSEKVMTLRVPRGSNRRVPRKTARSVIPPQHLYLRLLLLDSMVFEDLSHNLQYAPPSSVHLSHQLEVLHLLLHPGL